MKVMRSSAPRCSSRTSGSSLVKKARTLLVDAFEEDSLSEAIANELARAHGFIHVTDDLLVASVNVDETEEGTFLVSQDGGDRSVFLSRDDTQEKDN
jgi:hypothetical protein